MKYRKRKNVMRKKINKEIIKIVFCRFEEDMEEHLLQCTNIVLFAFFMYFILIPIPHPGLNFI